MNRKKEMSNEYKERRQYGGVYLITNTVNGKYLLDYAVNLKSVQNRFQFSMSIGGVLDHRLQKDWQEMGAKAFTFTVLEELEQKLEQGQEEFVEELKALKQLCHEKLDVAKEYS